MGQEPRSGGGPDVPATAPGWPEIAVVLGLYVLGIGALGAWLLQVPDAEAVFRINVAGAVNGLVGLLAWLAAMGLRVREPGAFGIRATTRRWLLVAAGLGVVAYGLSFGVEAVYFHFVSEPNTQADFQAAARAGTASLVLLLLTGAVLGPIGEELVFRGVIASALNRWGAAAGIIGSAALFAIVHGPSVILVDAFLVGLLLGIVFRRAGSIWPAIVLHVVYNGLHLVTYSAG